MKCLLRQESNILEICSGKWAKSRRQQLCEILAFYVCVSGTHDTEQLPYFVQQLFAF